jgi:hypothetical protein
MAQARDDDWHDSYEETDEMMHEWLGDCIKHAANVLRVGVERGVGIDKCHEILKAIADSWSNINAISFRGGAGMSGCWASSATEGCGNTSANTASYLWNSWWNIMWNS